MNIPGFKHKSRMERIKETLEEEDGTKKIR